MDQLENPTEAAAGAAPGPNPAVWGGTLAIDPRRRNSPESPASSGVGPLWVGFFTWPLAARVCVCGAASVTLKPTQPPLPRCAGVASLPSPAPAPCWAPERPILSHQAGERQQLGALAVAAPGKPFRRVRLGYFTVTSA